MSALSNTPDFEQPLMTKEGDLARVICFDADLKDGQTIIALIRGPEGEITRDYYPDGRWTRSGPHPFDLINIADDNSVVVSDFKVGTYRVALPENGLMHVIRGGQIILRHNAEGAAIVESLAREVITLRSEVARLKAAANHAHQEDPSP